jgi:hypothetical protein
VDYILAMYRSTAGGGTEAQGSRRFREISWQQQEEHVSMGEGFVFVSEK